MKTFPENLQEHIDVSRTGSNIFKYKYMPAIKITHLTDSDLFKIDYASTDNAASVDIVNSFTGIASSLMLHMYVVFGKYPKMASIDNMQTMLDLLQEWVDVVRAPEDVQVEKKPEPDPEPTMAKFAPQPDWMMKARHF